MRLNIGLLIISLAMAVSAFPVIAPAAGIQTQEAEKTVLHTAGGGKNGIAYERKADPEKNGLCL